MKQVAGLISTYSSDEFGICSALYELGGMVVMHDASGCNSTYTTHDEPRWYDTDSLIFISAISEMEAILGDDDKLVDDLVMAAKQFEPKFIAIVGAPIPYMLGTDLKALAAVTRERTGIPCMGFEANGMRNYTWGVSKALEAVAKEFCVESEKVSECRESQSLVADSGASKSLKEAEGYGVLANILGATPLDFCVNGSVEAIKMWLEENGINVQSCFAMGSSLENIKKAGQAQVNLVVSYGGLAAAKVLEKRFGTPYVVGVPFGEKFSGFLVDCLQKAAGEKRNIISFLEMAGDKNICSEKSTEKKVAIIGEQIFSSSLAAAIILEHPVEVTVCCPLDVDEKIMRSGDLQTPEEDDLIRVLPEFDGVIADPLYQALCAGKQVFYSLPHEAFSGRIYDAVNPNLIAKKLS